MADIHIAFGVTDNWVKYAFVTICSILSNAKKDDEYFFYIMSDDADTNFLPVLNKLNEVKPASYQFIKMDDSEFEGAVHDWLGVSSSYRLKLPSLTEVDKILYLDADIINLHDISELYSYDISDYYLAAVEDKWSQIMRRRVNLKEDEPFFNGGVQLMNLKKMRENNIEKLVFDKLREIHYYTDQDVVNDICRGKILSLPLKYNLMPVSDPLSYLTRQEEFKKTMENPYNIHFTDKAWAHKVKFGEFWHDYAAILDKEMIILTGPKKYIEIKGLIHG